MAGRDQALKSKVDEKLDEALKDSFPASDPVAFIQSHPVKHGDRELLVVKAADDARRPRPKKPKAARH